MENMNRKGVSVSLVVVLTLGSIVVLDFSLDISPQVKATTIYVDDDYGSEDATHKMTIQAAVDNASTGDSIFVYNGTYYENVVINKTLNIIGEDRYDTKIDGMGQICIFVKQTEYVNITTFYILNGSRGINVESSHDCNFSNIYIRSLEGEDHEGHGDDGGIGIYSELSSIYIQGSSIYGGNGGDATYEGSILLYSFGGNGGDAIYAINSSLNLRRNFIYGGDGGNADWAFDWSYGGDGGNGICLEYSFSNATSGIKIIGGSPGQGQHFLGSPGDGLHLENSYKKVINNTIIGGYLGYGVWSFNSLSDIINCTLYGDVIKPPFITYYNDKAFYLKGNAHITALNSDFNRTNVYFKDNKPILRVHWYLHTHVTSTLFQPIPSATVCIKDKQNSLPAQKYTTDSEGYIRWLTQTEYIEQDTNGDTIGEKTYYTPHRITAWNETLMGYAEVNINESKEVNIVLDTPYYEIPLSAGWNLISLPLVQSDTSISAVLSSIAGNWDVVWWYNASGGTWHSTNDDLTDINHTMGLWIHMKTADTLIVNGTIPNTTFIQLYQGWNLVGNPSFCIHGIDDILSPIATKYTAVQQYDSWDAGDPWKHYRINKPPNLNDLAYMTSGRGYWLYVTEDVVWEVSNF